jgi:hypothetical protein
MENQERGVFAEHNVLLQSYLMPGFFFAFICEVSGTIVTSALFVFSAISALSDCCHTPKALQGL